MEGIEYPVQIKDIPKVERLNPRISINLFGFEQKSFFPIHVGSGPPREQHVNLLLFSKGELNHYCCITDLNSCLAHTTTRKKRSFFCVRCLHRFSRQRLLDAHVPHCLAINNNCQALIMPTEEEKYVEFKNYHHLIEIPFVIYCDIETMAIPIHSCKPDVGGSTSFTHAEALHQPCSFSYIVLERGKGIVRGPVVRTGNDPNLMEEMIGMLLKEEEWILKELQNDRPAPFLFPEDREALEQSTPDCCICRKPFLPDQRKVVHHNHRNGHFLGLAHNRCNLLARQTKRIPVVMHGMSNFDSHFLILAMKKFLKDDKYTFSGFGRSREKLISFRISNLIWLDSYQFLPSSLAVLVQNLKQQGADAFPCLKQIIVKRAARRGIPSVGEELLTLLLRKGVFCYNYLSRFDRLQETQLPSREHFYNSLKKEELSVEDYEYAKLVFEKFGCRNLKDYMQLYLITDVLLLADVFEAFRSLCISSFELDPLHYYSSPGLSFDACLKKTRVCLELLTDMDMLLFFQKAVRGGVAQISQRFAEARNPYLKSETGEPMITEEMEDVGEGGGTTKKKNRYLVLYDVNSMYGHAMCQKMPVSAFRWLSEDEIASLKVSDVPDDADTGYFLEVDLHYPLTLHEAHQCFPLAPEKGIVTWNMLSPYSHRLHRKLYGEKSCTLPRVDKLLCTLHDKERYVLHYRTLKLYLELGLELRKVHRVAAFHQQDWIRPYIEFNSIRRQEAKNEFEKSFWKLLNNSFFGKTLQDDRHHESICLVSNKHRFLSLIASPTFKSFKSYSEDLAAVFRIKPYTKMVRPIPVGTSVLDLSKEILYRFFYLYEKAKYGNENVKLLATDTDSLLLSVDTVDLYKDMLADQHLFDFSDYPRDHFLYSPSNKKVPGKMKDETNGKPIFQFVGLRPKLYSILLDAWSRACKKAAKGVCKTNIEKDLSHEDYVWCLFEEELKRLDMTLILQDLHRVYTVCRRKVALSCADDKRYILDDGVHSLPYGHKDIVAQQQPDSCSTEDEADENISRDENDIQVEDLYDYS